MAKPVSVEYEEVAEELASWANTVIELSLKAKEGQLLVKAKREWYETSLCGVWYVLITHNPIQKPHNQVQKLRGAGRFAS